MPPEKKNIILQGVQTILLGLISLGVTSCIVFLININRTIGVMTEKDVQHELGITELQQVNKDAVADWKNLERRITVLETKGGMLSR